MGYDSSLQREESQVLSGITVFLLSFQLVLQLEFNNTMYSLNDKIIYQLITETQTSTLGYLK